MIRTHLTLPPSTDPPTPLFDPKNNLQQIGLLTIMLLREVKGLSCDEEL